MVEETPQINPIDPDPEASTTSNGSGSPWKTNGVVSQPSFTPAAAAPGDAPAKAKATAKADAAPAPEAESAPESTATEAEAAQPEAKGADGPGGPDDGTIFLASLAKAMQDAATAERTRVGTDTDQRRDAHIAAINTRRESEQTRMQELADEDRKAIDDWVAAEQQRIQDEKERRTAALEADLKTSLGEHGAKIDREIERVEAAIVVYRSDVDTYFARLEGDTDPLVIAQHAARRPAFPDLEKIGRSTDPATDATATSTAEGAATTDRTGGSNGGAATDATDAAAAATTVAAEPPSDSGDATSGDGGGTVDAIADSPGTTEAPDVAPTEPVAISAAKAVGVMESSKPPTKLAQAWAAWNESTKSADAAAADQAAKAQAEVESYTLTPPAATPAQPATAASDKTSAASTATGDSMAEGSAAVAAGTWKPPVEDAPQSLAGGAMSWLRRDRDRDQGGR